MRQKTKKWPKPLRAAYVKTRRAVRVRARHSEALIKRREKLQALIKAHKKKRNVLSDLCFSLYRKESLMHLASPKSRLRVEGLSKWGYEKALRPMVFDMAKHDPSSEVRTYALSVLIELQRQGQTKAALPLLLARIDFETFEAKKRLITKLGHLGGPVAEAKLIEIMGEKKGKRALRAAEALGWNNSQKAIDSLANDLRRPGSQDQKLALQYLTRLTQKMSLEASQGRVPTPGGDIWAPNPSARVLVEKMRFARKEAETLIEDLKQAKDSPENMRAVEALREKPVKLDKVYAGLVNQIKHAFRGPETADAAITLANAASKLSDSQLAGALDALQKANEQIFKLFGPSSLPGMWASFQRLIMEDYVRMGHAIKAGKNAKDKRDWQSALDLTEGLLPGKQMVLVYAIMTDPEQRRRLPKGKKTVLRQTIDYFNSIKREVKNRPLYESAVILKVGKKK